MLRIREGGTVLKAVYPVLGKQTSLPFYVSGIGICEPEYRVSRPQGLVSHQFLITSSGSGKLIVGERTNDMQATEPEPEETYSMMPGFPFFDWGY